jgi:hypothetical protein
MIIPSRKGFYLWQLMNCEAGDPEQIARMARAAGLGHVKIKIADGTHDYNVSVSIPRTIQALRTYNPGIQILGWQFVYGYDPIGEAQKAVERILELNLDGFAVDAEAEYKLPGRRLAAITYMDRLRSGVGDAFPIGLSSYRYPSYHPQIPWKEFLSRCDYNAPQVYWMYAHNPGQQLERCLAEFHALNQAQGIPPLPIIPTGAAWKENGWQVTPAEVIEFLDTAKRLALGGANFWSWQHARRLPDVWDAVAGYKWGDSGGELPPPPPAPALKMRVIQDRLRVRSGPGTGFLELRRLKVGEEFVPSDVGGDSAWVQIAPGEWTNVEYHGDRNMEPVESA